MPRIMKAFVVSLILFSFPGCATVEDVRRASDLIRADNELTRLLVEVRPQDQAGAATFLVGLGLKAESEADALSQDNATIPDALAYYRIAATAYWRSANAEIANDLFKTANKGSDLCLGLQEKAPDRDCLFLQLVIPFAGLEANANESGLSELLKTVNFNDGNATPEEIETMGEVRNALNQAKLLVVKIFAIGADDRFLSHAGMRDYYCENSRKAFRHYDATAGVFVTKVKEYDEKFPNHTPALGITVDEAREIRKLEENVPAFCGNGP